MQRFYLILRKKSIVLWLILPALLFGNAAPVTARIPNDPNYSLQADFYSQIEAEAAWELTTGNDSVVVAIIDTGVDITHPDLQPNIWNNQDEVAANGVDDDKNGYIDDVHGWNFVENNNDIALSVINESDDSGAVHHGTLLAGLIGAAGNNNLLGTGLNWNVQIMPVRAIDNSGGGVLQNVAQAVRYAADNGADIISISFVGFTTYPDLTAALYNAYRKGVLVVTAAGNSRNDNSGNANLTKIKQYPICLDWDYTENWVLGVASVDNQDRLSGFADYGSCIDISAPGEGIFSTQKLAPQHGLNKDFDGAWYGTSFAAPLVAGGAALVKSIRPDWKAKELIDVLLRTTDEIDSLNPGFAGQMGYGRLNVGKAVQMAIDSKKILVKPPVVYTTKLISKLIKKQKTYYVQVLANGKTVRDFTIPSYSATLSKWAVTENLFVYARSEKNRVVVDAWDFSGAKKISGFVLSGFSSLSKVTIENLWGNSPNAVLTVKRGVENKRIILDIPSKSWKIE